MSSALPPGVPPAPDAAAASRPLRPGDSRAQPVLAGPAASARLRRALSVALLLAIDLTALFIGLFAALSGKLVLNGDAFDADAIWASEQRALPLAALTMVLIFAKNGLYATREQRGGTARVLSSVALATVIVAAVVLIGGWRFDTYYIFYSTWILVSIAAVVLRASYDSVTSFLLDAAGFERRALLVGPPAMAAQIGHALVHAGSRHSVPYSVVGHHELVHDGDDPQPELARAIDPGAVDEVILAGAPRDEDANRVLELVDLCRRRGIPVRLAPTAVELLSHSLHAMPAPGLQLFDVRPPVLTAWSFLAKRAFDIVVASLLLVVLSPLLIGAALAIWIGDRGEIIHRSRRVGLNETEFTCFKLRTMRVGAEDEQDDLERSNEADGAIFKIRDDPRVTAVGRFLRRFSIDELPQLMNVLRGEMSLVGPRPLPLRDFDRLSPLHKKRYMVLPGLTGLWQVSGAAKLSFDELVRLDFFYIDSWSIWLDLTILAKTIPVVIGRRGQW